MLVESSGNYITTVDLINDQGQVTTALATDISQGGMFVTDPTRSLGETVIVTYLLGFLPIQQKAKVVECTPEGAALEFTDNYLTIQ